MLPSVEWIVSNMFGIWAVDITYLQTCYGEQKLNMIAILQRVMLYFDAVENLLF